MVKRLSLNIGILTANLNGEKRLVYLSLCQETQTKLRLSFTLSYNQLKLTHKSGTFNPTADNKLFGHLVNKKSD
jgi:hypothetical protein